MSNPFLVATIRQINLHGIEVTYRRVTNGAYNADTKEVATTTTDTTIKSYKLHDSSMQFRYPSLVGKDIAEFYIAANALALIPKENDQIIVGSENYVVKMVKEHAARGEICLYCVVATR